MYCFEHWAIMLGCYSAVSVQSRGNFNDYQCFSFTLPLARAAQAKIQMLTAICSIVKLLPWNLVNLSHLYKIIPMLLWNGLHPIISRPNLRATAPSSISSIKILMERSSRKRKKKDGFYRFCLVNCPENFALSCTLHSSALLHSVNPCMYLCT